MISPFHDNIACDTGAILLTAYFNKRSINVQALTEFLAERKPYTGIADIFSPDHPYIHALKKIFSSLNTYNREYRTVFSDKTSRILTLKEGYAAVIAGGDDHMAVVARNRSEGLPWRIYQFVGNDSLLANLCNDYKKFFLSSKTGKVVINGYMRMGSKTMPEL